MLGFEAIVKDDFVSNTSRCHMGLPRKILYLRFPRGIHCTENPIYVFPEMKLRGLVPNSYIHVSVSGLYIPRIHMPIWLQQNRQIDLGIIWLQQNRQIDLGIYKSLTDR
jgi:hypothetical protein